MAMERFHFEHDGNEYEMPHLNQLKIGLKTEVLEAAEVAKTSPHKIFRAFIKAAGVIDDSGSKAVEDMDEEQFGEIFKAWVEATKAASGK